ncbi:hypothetical protein JOC54_000541 [Alkalihalobacillus xiaoxiensis]|uniref:CopG family transcriptional regulator n=1 Tax=Shouchella xiaoxiensis TaxID=766895 RepID=A0ABS2SP73_9BACI|nr:hypothetical protein [Shouchella xiaoxiensis]
MPRIPKLIKFPEDVVVNIKKFQSENEISTFSKAVYTLINKGLKSN